MPDEDVPETPAITRRKLLRAGVIAGGTLVWSAPVIKTASAGNGVPGYPPGPGINGCRYRVSVVCEDEAGDCAGVPPYVCLECPDVPVDTFECNPSESCCIDGCLVELELEQEGGSTDCAPCEDQVVTCDEPCGCEED